MHEQTRALALVTLIAGVACAPSERARRAAEPKTEGLCGVDVHVHVGRPDAQKGDVQWTRERAALAAEAAGISQIWIVSNGYYDGTAEADVRAENDYVLAPASPGRTSFVAVPSVPVRAAFSASEIVRVAGLGARVLKLHVAAAGVDLRTVEGEGSLDLALGAAQASGLAVLLHANVESEDEARVLLRVVDRHRRAPVILAHALTRHHALLRDFRRDHVFVDLSAVVAWPWFISGKSTALNADARAFARELVVSIRAFGVERAFFGSDMPFLTPAEALRLFEALPFDARERAAILRENVRLAFPGLARACAASPAGR